MRFLGRCFCPGVGYSSSHHPDPSPLSTSPILRNRRVKPYKANSSHRSNSICCATIPHFGFVYSRSSHLDIFTAQSIGPALARQRILPYISEPPVDWHRAHPHHTQINFKLSSENNRTWKTSSDHRFVLNNVDLRCESKSGQPKNAS
jgi:hypothetical protein